MTAEVSKFFKYLRLVVLITVVGRSLYTWVFTPAVLPPALLTPATLPIGYQVPATIVTDQLRIVTLDPTQLTGQFSLTLFDNTTYVALVDHVEENGRGNFIWFGHLAGQGDSQIKVVVQDQQISGVITLRNSHYELQRLRDNLYALYEENTLT